MPSSTTSGWSRSRRWVPSISTLGAPDELAAAICFLLSQDAGFITGQTIRVDGGSSVAA